MIVFQHRGPALIRLSVIYAKNIQTYSYPANFDSRLEALLINRKPELNPGEEKWRKSVRNMLRHGRFKPTGRAKPASEYLLGAARKGFFPRINSIVDICNYISLKYLLPVSIWDVDLSRTDHFLVRLGKPEESYIFNQAGQHIDLEDLVVGCAVQDLDSPDDEGTPIVNPVKDSQETKTHDNSDQITAIIYAPLLSDQTSNQEIDQTLPDATDEFVQLISHCGDAVSTGSGILGPGMKLELKAVLG